MTDISIRDNADEPTPAVLTSLDEQLGRSGG